MKMKRILIPLMAIMLFAACTSDDETTPKKEQIAYPSEITGVWTDFLLFDGSERDVTFDASTMTAEYTINRFSENISEETVKVPYTYDSQKGVMVMDFKNVSNPENMANITFNMVDEENMVGVINYNVSGTKPDTLLLTYLCEAYFHWSSQTALESSMQYAANAGPESIDDLMPALEWDNPFGGETVASSKSRSIAMLSMLAWVGKQLGTAAFLQVGKYSVDQILEQILPGYDDTGKSIKKIVQDIEVIKDKLNNIDAKIDELARQNRIAEATKSLTDRNDRFNDLCISISSTMRIIDMAIRDSTNTADDDSLIIVNAVLQWGDGMYHDNKRTDAANVYASKAKQAYGNYSYPELYDIFAYETNDWEHKGYEWREMLRTTDIALVSSAIEMSALYWLFKSKVSPREVSQAMMQMHIEDLEQVCDNMEKLYMEKEVVRHPDKLICQIPGFHLVFDSKVEWRNLSNPTWYPKKNDMPLSVEALLYGGESEFMNIGKQRFLTETEFNKLCSYYTSIGGSVLNLFKELGFNVNTDEGLDSYSAMMVLPSGAYVMPTIALDRNDYVYFDAAISNDTRRKKTGVKVGEIYAPLITGSNFILNFLRNEKYFDHYVNYEDHTWFNLRVLDRQ